jgi:tRNA-binding protein
VARIQDVELPEIAVGTVVDAQPLPASRPPCIRLWIDFGAPLGVKRSADKLIGRQVLALTSLPPREVAGFDSEVLTLGVPDEDGAMVLLKPDFKVPDGGRMF